MRYRCLAVDGQAVGRFLVRGLQAWQHLRRSRRRRERSHIPGNTEAVRCRIRSKDRAVYAHSLAYMQSNTPREVVDNVAVVNDQGFPSVDG